MIAFGRLVTTVQCGSSLGSSLPLIISKRGCTPLSSAVSTSTPQSGQISTHGSYSYPQFGQKWCTFVLMVTLYQTMDDGRWTMDDGPPTTIVHRPSSIVHRPSSTVYRRKRHGTTRRIASEMTVAR